MSQELSLHPEAAKAFDEKGEALLKLVRAMPKGRPAHPNYAPQIHSMAHFTEKDIIGEVEWSLSDMNGDTVAECVTAGKEPMGLFGEGYQTLRFLAESIQRTATFRNCVSLQCLCKVITRWVRSNYMKPKSDQLSSYVLTECQHLIRDLAIWIPICRLHIQSNIVFGNVIFQTISAEMIDKWHAHLKFKNQEQELEVQRFLERERTELQGHAAATIKVSGEPIKATEIAFEEAEKATSLLRFFAPANFLPRGRSFCTPLGKERMDRSNHLTIVENSIASFTKGSVYQGQKAWILDNSEITHMQKNGLEKLSSLLSNKNKSPFQQDLETALLIYSKSSLSADPSEKLLHILTALESVLLNDESEPVQHTLTERIAFLIGRSRDDRIEIARRFKSVYKLRSRFVHHGESIEELGLLAAFMHDSWKCLWVLVDSSDSITKREDLIRNIERRKFE